MKREIQIVSQETRKALLGIFSLFRKHGKEIYLVGGCIRDLLLGKEPSDYDLTTNATPEEVLGFANGLGYRALCTGLKHGTVSLLDLGSKLAFDVTTYRIDHGYSDGRHPDSVEFSSSLEEDLKRRDFTINSFAYDIMENELLMLDESFLMDLTLRLIRCVGDPNERFREDALRMLRAIRFSSQLGFTIEEKTYKAIVENSGLLSMVSKERIASELTKILLSDNPQGLELFSLSGLEEGSRCFREPYIKKMIECRHESPWHYADVFHHTMDVVKALPKDFDLRWAGLLHDIGKPYAKKPSTKQGEYGKVYHNHPEESLRIANEVMASLKFPNRSQDRIGRFVRMHDLPLDSMTNRKFKKAVAEIGKDDFLDYLRLRDADANAHRLMNGTEHLINSMSRIKERFSKVLINNEPVYISDLDIDGNDLKRLGANGKMIGDCLHYLLDKALSNPSVNKKATLTDIARSFIIKHDKEGGSI